MSSMFASLRQRNYRIYAMGSLVSNVGTWMFRTALAWLTLELTGSGAALGAIMATQALPLLVFAPAAGTVADRVDKRRALLIAQIVMAVPAGLLGILAILGVATPWQVFVLSFVFGTSRAFEAPIRQSFVAELVNDDQLANAIALNSASFNGGRLVGPGVAGALIALWGSGPQATGWVILANAASYFAVVLSLTALDRSRIHPAVRAVRGQGSFRGGLRYLRSRPDLTFVFLIVFFVSTFAMNFQVTSALMATEVFGLGAGAYGALGSALAIGSVTGALFAARAPRRGPWAIAGFGAVFAVLCGVGGLMPTVWAYALFVPLQGACVLSMMTAANTFVQMTSEPSMRGRMASIYLMVFWGGTPLGSPLIGWIGEAFGGRWSLYGSGGLALAGLAGAAAWFRHRQTRG